MASTAGANADPTAPPFQPLPSAVFDFDVQPATGQIVPGPYAPQLLIGTAADAAAVAGIRARVAQIAAPEISPLPPAPEPATPAAPAAPTTDVSRIGTAAYDFIDITTSQRVRIETRGGDDFIRFGNGSPGPDITAVVIGADGRESIEGRGARVIGRFELGGGTDNIYGTFAAGTAVTALLGSGNDSARFNTGTNYLDGGADNDTLFGGDGADTLIGGDGVDALYGESFSNFDTPAPGGDDLLLGGIGNDSLYGAGGNDQLSGGDGDDLVYGMWGDDRLWGGAGADRLQGGTGNDFLRGGAGVDTLYGEADNDQLDGGDGDDQIFGGDGDDLLTDASGNDRLNGGIGNDRIRGGAGNNIIEGDAGDDILIAEAGDDTVNGGAGNDTLVGGAGNDRLFAGDGNDNLLDGDGNDWLDGDAGDDVLIATTGNDMLYGWEGKDTLVAGDGTDTLDGGGDDDILIDSAGSVTLTGGNGNDIFIVTNARTVVREYFNQGTDDVAYVYVNGWIPPSGIERVIYMDGAAPPSTAVLALHATSLRPDPNITTTFRYIFVEAPYNWSKDGTSLFQGVYLPEGQSLQMVALDQNFRLAFRQAADEYERVANIRFVEVTTLSEADFAVGSHNMTPGGYATLGVTPGGSFIDNFMISSAASTSGLLRGGFNHSTMLHELGHTIGLKHPFDGNFQLAGSDTDNGRFSQLSYGLGKSSEGLMIFDIETARLIYGTRAVAAGNDVYRFDQANRFHAGLVDDGGIDVVDLSGNANGATLDLGAGNFSTVNISLINQTIFARNLGIANGTTIENALGTRFADRITGNAADNRIEGGAGDDVIDGGDGSDTAVYATAGAAVTVNLGLAAAQNTLGAGSDTLSNFENLQGSPFNDTLIGNGLANRFEGGAGNDLLDGSGGIDTAVYLLGRQEISFVRNGDGSVTITAGAEGSDRLSGIEQLQFGGAMFALSRFDGAPGIRLGNFTVGAGGWTSQDRFLRQMADVNGDGLADIVGFGQAGTLLALGTAGGSFAAPGLAVANFGQDQGWSSDNIFRRELADVNGDGRDDIVGFGTAGVLVSLAQAGGTFGAVSLGSTNFNPANGWTSQNGFARTLADVNGDGRADIVGFGTPGTFVALGTASGSFGAATFALANFGSNQGWSANSIFHREVGDVNGDGRADIVGFGTAGTLVALGQANGTFGAANFALANFGTNQGWSTQDVFTRDLADVNGDGREDIVGFGIAGTFVAYGQANGLFSSASFDLANFGRDQGWTSDNIFHRELADVNGDGRADIIGFGQNGVFAAVAFDGQVI